MLNTHFERQGQQLSRATVIGFSCAFCMLCRLVGVDWDRRETGDRVGGDRWGVDGMENRN